MSRNALRIGLFTHSVNPRGGVVHTVELATALTARGHRVTVFAPASERETLFRLPPCEVVHARIDGTQRNTVELVDARIRAIRRALLAHALHAFDVLHAQDSISGNALAELKAERRIAGFVRTVHHLDHFDDARLAAWQHRAFADADRVLCVSDTWTARLRETYGIDAQTVRNGVDTQRFSAQPQDGDVDTLRALGIRDASRVVLSVGGIEARKNTLGLLEAFARLRGDVKDASNVQLVIAGGASLLDHDAYTRAFLARAAELDLAIGANEAIVLTGPLADDAIPALMRRADVLAMVSLREGFGLVVLEALASHTPVIASNIAPFTEYLDDATCCWASPTDIASIADALARVLNGTHTTDFERAVPALIDRYSWEASATQHDAQYRAYLDAPVAAPIDAPVDASAFSS